MKALVVGGAGYIGSVVTRQLLAEGHRWSCWTTAPPVTPTPSRPGSSWSRRDITNAAEVLGRRRVRRGAAFRRQVAGRRVGRRSRRCTGGPTSAAPGRCWTRSPRTASRRWCSPRPRPPTASPSRCRSPRTPPTRPTNTYGATKLAVDMMITGECAATDLAAVSLRYFNVAGAAFGAGERHRTETHLIPIALDAVAGRRDGADHLRRRLAHPRRHPDPRLRARRGPGPRARAGADRGRPGRAPDLQPGQRQRVQRPRGAGHHRRGHRPTGAGHRRTAPRRRPDPAGRLRRAGRRSDWAGRRELTLAEMVADAWEFAGGDRTGIGTRDRQRR